jgi:hypothetical protein
VCAHTECSCCGITNVIHHAACLPSVNQRSAPTDVEQVADMFGVRVRVRLPIHLLLEVSCGPYSCQFAHISPVSNHATLHTTCE